ncbi:hypothetical protein BXZ70DRAFT_1074523 [Cristinia sonorae]|uniref:Voltage-gated hydrogen channel 1 n=1 Tax=Cristinia sonorae TaxID=1940300 RepID=A0A8K0UWM5_9AGAR|nr:hypothetical protein BXZ70DRAFT_1074523 [Cristinia sonorae]
MAAASEQQPLLDRAGDDIESNHEDTSQSTHTKWKLKTADFLESAPLHYTVLTLVVIDTACVLADLGYTVLSDTCTPIEGGDAPLWLNILAQLSLTITTLFLIEIPVTLWALGWSFFNPFGDTPHATLHLFDALVIVTTFVLEIVLRGKERELASLLIILRLWRLVKLVGGIAVGAGDLAEEDAKDLAEARQGLEQTLNELAKTREENKQLRQRIAVLAGESTFGDD